MNVSALIPFLCTFVCLGKGDEKATFLRHQVVFVSSTYELQFFLLDLKNQLMDLSLHLHRLNSCFSFIKNKIQQTNKVWRVAWLLDYALTHVSHIITRGAVLLTTVEMIQTTHATYLQIKQILVMLYKF